jgi:pSer/pThr/pTyr-binding forkhead associated (FHA) protein
MKLAFKFEDGRVVSHEVYERAFKIGRSDSCRVTIDSEHFSREHAMIELVDGKVFVTDLNSKNGIFINHIRIPKKMKTTYDLKLPLYMGECFLTLDVKEDLRDPDHLSLETFTKIDPNEMYKPLTPPKRPATRPKPVAARAKKGMDKKVLVIAALILGAIVAFAMYRHQIMEKFPHIGKVK